jgi:hypothetical protein
MVPWVLGHPALFGELGAAARWPPPHTGAAGAWFSVLILLAGIGLVRGQRRGASLFCVAFLALTSFGLAAVGSAWPDCPVCRDSVLLLYAAFGAAALAAPGRKSALASA